MLSIRPHLSVLMLLMASFMSSAKADVPNSRCPSSEEELRYWLQNMIWHHRFSVDEIRLATGLSVPEIAAARERLNIHIENRPQPEKGSPPLVLPYPGGRHPRIGFLEGAIDPQRETKFSVFAPWDDTSYVVVDVPEAIWSNLGLTYLAHTHIPTIWTAQNIDLPKLEWNRRKDGSLDIERKLPNGIVFDTRINPDKAGVRMTLTLKNGSKELLTDLRVQNCVMLKGARGFDQQTNDNKVMQSPYVACRNEAADRWIITAWQPIHRPWANPPCPCLHADPKFPDCPPGETRILRGWLSLYEGRDIQGEFKRLDGIGWNQAVTND